MKKETNQFRVDKTQRRDNEKINESRFRKFLTNISI